MATSILDAGLTAATSEEFTLGDKECIFLAVYSETGEDLPAGPVLTLQRADINGNFITVATIGVGAVRLMAGCQQVTVTMPGTYRVSRPDISVWNFAVGIQTGI